MKEEMNHEEHKDHEEIPHNRVSQTLRASFVPFVILVVQIHSRDTRTT